MTRVKDQNLERLLGWPEGLDNLSAETELPIGLVSSRDGKPHGSLRVAENVNLDESGKVTSRAGFTLVGDYPGMHSVWASEQFPVMLAAYNGYLVWMDQTAVPTNIVALSAPTEPMSYDIHAGWVYYSNGFDSGRYNGEVRQEWAIMPPLSAPVLAEYASGGLDAGTYQVALTYRDAYGRESGASQYDEVTIAAGKGILISAIPTTSDSSVTTVRVYCSRTNGTICYAVNDIPAGTASYLIGVHTPGAALETGFHEPLPAGHIVRFHNGRQYVFRNKVLFWSEALRPGQTVLQSNYLSFNARGDLLEGVGEGPQAELYAAAGNRTYLLSGDDPSKWNRRIAHPHGAVPGSSTRVDATAVGEDQSGRIPFWLDNDGQFVLGMPGGVKMLHKDRYAAETGVERGATVLREAGGLRHLISVLRGGQTSNVAVSDSVDAEVWKDGVRLS